MIHRKYEKQQIFLNFLKKISILAGKAPPRRAFCLEAGLLLPVWPGDGSGPGHPGSRL
jgi:hypothetical protein